MTTINRARTFQTNDPTNLATAPSELSRHAPSLVRNPPIFSVGLSDVSDESAKLFRDVTSRPRYNWLYLDLVGGATHYISCVPSGGSVSSIASGTGAKLRHSAVIGTGIVEKTFNLI